MTENRIDDKPPETNGTGGAADLIRSAGVREAARMAALQTELRVLGDLASNEAIAGLRPYLAMESSQLRPYTLIRSERDARFHLPKSRMREALRQFGSSLEAPLTTTSTLIVVAHPDDESIGAGAQIARLQEVTVVHVTDGAPTSPEYAQCRGYDSATEYSDARRREAAEALTLAGVPESRQLCLGIPDGEAAFNLVDLALVLAETIDRLQPEVLLTQPYEGGHTDHDATAFAVHLACGILRREGTPTPVVLELTSYHSRGGRRAVHRFLPYDGSMKSRTVRLSREARDLKRRMYECYRTQERCLRQFSVAVERFRPAPRYNFTEAPHNGTLDYERLCRRMTGQQWREQARRALDQLRQRERGWISMAEVSPTTFSSTPTRFVQPAA